MAKNKLEEQKQIRVAVIDYDRCQPDSCGNFLCARVCPVNKNDKECIVPNMELYKPIISEELCIGCQICVIKCPFNAISILNLTAKLGDPIHQFGENTFRVYKRIPLARPGGIVGIIGRNGLGKTTILDIVAGKIIPNLGDYESKAEYDKVIEFFKGKELQGFFEKLKTNTAKIAHKPQKIEDLPKVVSGKVDELLKKVDERNKYEEVVDLMHLSHLLDRSIDELSGGELQRIAIAATVLKDAEVYAFDEPSTFLDVAERLKMAKVLRNLTDENKSVIVIEHDLAVLDYLSDYIYILFGKQGVYGVVSNSKSVKNGINEFLEGYLPDENLRFRESELKFEVKPPADLSNKNVLLTYPTLGKKYKTFELNVEEGEIRSGEVIGILGPNGIGKTTFVKMLAGLEKPDKGKVDIKLTISYKPQYLEAEKEVTVKELLAKTPIDLDLFKTEIDRRLRITDLEDKKVETLSGGELQRVAVGLALARKSDLLLLDEPSAFIDVEDRLKVADAIRSVVDKTNKVALVVDHDILFQDYVSDRLMIFDGEPSIKGHAERAVKMKEGMNTFLKNLGITYRRDPSTGRPRANKPGSVKDQEQKKNNEYFYTEA